MSNIFISYRREDAAPYAGRLCDHLNRLAGAGRVFMDVEDITPGQQFAKTIDDTIARCGLLLIVIGPKWADILRERAQEPKPDYVAHEIESALKRQITVVPVLVGGATISCLDNLPGTLSSLSQYEIAELRDNSFNEDCERLAASLKLKRRVATFGRTAAAVSVVLSLAVAGWLLYGSWSAARARKAALDQVFATAKSQTDRGEYEAAFRTYQGIQKSDPQNRAAMDLQVDAAMGWLEDFHVIVPEGAKAENLAGPLLDEILPVMDAGLARTDGKGTRAADILAHIGWAHWLNRHIAEREFGPAAERDLRKAIEIDASNVYANAMLGNLLMQTGGNTKEALEHFRVAVKANKARPFVRELQLGVLHYPDDSETRVALIQVVNEMRQNREPLDERQKSRILSSYSSTVHNAEEITETLSAVPPADAWATYLWLEQGGRDSESARVQREFIHARILELEGKRPEALAEFQTLRGELKRLGYDGRIASHVEGGIKRLSAP